MEYLKSSYETVFYEKADPRVKSWPLMTSPWPIVLITVMYLTLIKLVLPKYMENRKAFGLKSVIKWYNIIQIISNVVVTWGLMTSGWITTYHFGCVLPDYSMNPEALRMLRFMWWTFVLKLMELVETMFFILRKKDRQASFLHVYHHISSMIIIWIGVKYVGGGFASFPPMINCAVHVIMYTYYLLAAEGGTKLKAFLHKYKKWLTVIQMVQFTIILIYSSQIFLPSCPAPVNIGFIFIPNVIFVYYLFYDFFKKNYINKEKKHSGSTNGYSVKAR